MNKKEVNILKKGKSKKGTEKRIKTIKYKTRTGRCNQRLIDRKSLKHVSRPEINAGKKKKENRGKIPKGDRN